MVFMYSTNTTTYLNSIYDLYQSTCMSQYMHTCVRTAHLMYVNSSKRFFRSTCMCSIFSTLLLAMANNLSIGLDNSCSSCRII